MRSKLETSIRAKSLVDSTGRVCRPLMASLKDRAKYAGRGDRLQYAGSCVLFEINDELFVATASHVMHATGELLAAQEMVVQVGSRLEQLNGDTYGSTETLGVDNLDFGILHCNTECRSRLANEPRLGIGQIDLEDSLDSGAQYAVQGFPETRVRRHVTRTLTKFEGFVLTTESTTASAYEALGLRDETHLLLQFDREAATNMRGHRPPSVKGVSGGAVWKLASEPEAPQHDRLVGLPIEYRKSAKVIVAIRMAVVIEFLRLVAPQLMGGVPKSSRVTILPV